MEGLLWQYILAIIEAMQAVLIAAGESSRFWPLANGTHKSQIFLLGKSLIYWTLKGFKDAGIQDVVVVHGKGSSLPEMLEQENDLEIKISFVVQEESLGTGNALWQAREFITQPFFVVWPNKVNIGELAENMLKVQKEQSTDAVLVGAETKTPHDYGIARIKGDQLVEIVENPEEGKEPSNIKVIGLYLLSPDFFSYYESIAKHHEADLIEGINLYVKDKKASLIILKDEAPALKYPWELFGIMDILFSSQKEQQIIHPTAKIGKGTILEGFVYIGENCEIGANNVIRGPVNLEKGVKTGAFFEIKHSIVQEGTHFHSGYVGDSIIGKNCRFGAGFVVANKRLDRKTIACRVGEKKIDTGRTSFGTVIGNNTRVAIHAGIMPGVFVGSGCTIGPGAMVFQNIPDDTKFSARTPS